MTHITGRLVHADGVEAYGRCVISWPSFSIYGVSIAGGMMYLEIADGNLACDLYPCGAAVPPGMYYTARFELDSGAVYEEYWIVPDSPNVTLEQIRVAFPVAPGLAVSPTQITGMGAQPGMILSWNGSNWVGGWVQVSNVDPNYIRLEVGTAGTDFWIDGTPVMLGASARLNLPDASPTARGVVTTGPQSFGGNKTFVGTIDSPTIVALDARLDAIEATGAAVQKVFGRTGLVVAMPGDYTVAQVTGAVPDSRQVLAGAGMTGGGALTGNITLNADVLSVNGRTGAVVLDATDIGTAGGVPVTRQVIAGSGMTGGGPLSSDVVLNANVTSVFGRTGSVVLQASDVTAVGGVLDTRQILAGYGLTGGGDLKQDRTLSVVDNKTIQKLEIAKGGVVIGTHKQLNLQEGSNITLNVTDDIPNDRVNVTVTAVPIGGASPSNYWVNGGLIGTRPTLNLIQGPNTIVEGLDQVAGNRVDVTITAGAGASVPATRQVIAGYGLTGGGALSADVTLAVVDGQSIQKLQIAKNNTVIGTEKQINLIEGSNIVLTMFDSPVNNRVDVTINSSISGVPSTRSIIAGYGLTGGGDLSVDRTLAVVDGQSIQKVQVAKGGTVAGTQKQINFLQGANTTVTLTDVGASNRVDVKIDSAAGGQNQTPWLTDIDANGKALTNTGNIGVGTASPQSPLHVHKAGTGGHWLRLSIGTNGGPLIGFFSNSTQLDASIQSVNAAAPGGELIFNTTNLAGAHAERMRISANGRLGIGIPNPAYLLDVAGDCNITGVYRINGVPITGGAQTPWLTNIDAAGKNLSNLFTLGFVGGSAYGHPVINYNIEGVMRWQVGVNYQSLNYSIYRLNAAGANVDESIRIDGTTGNITLARFLGINTTTPVASVDIVAASQPASDSGAGAGMFRLGTGTTNTSKCLLFGVDDANGSWIQAIQAGVAHQNLCLNPMGANVGIGTASPTTKLQVIGIASVRGTPFGAAGDTCELQLPDAANRIKTVFGTGIVVDVSGAAGAMTIANGGNVGIGTTSPGNLLCVMGGATPTPGLRIGTYLGPLYYWDIGRENQITGDFLFNCANNAAPVERMRITTSGNVGVSGGITAAGDIITTTGVVRIGNDAGSGNFGWDGYAGDLYLHGPSQDICYFRDSTRSLIVNGNVQAATFGTPASGNLGIAAPGVAPGPNQIVRTESNGYTYVGHLAHNPPSYTEEGGGIGAFMCKWPSDPFLRGFSLFTAANAIFAQTCTGNIGIQHGGLAGVSMGTSLVTAGAFGGIYWNDADASMNIYHSSKGHIITIKNDGNIYFPSLTGAAGAANSGRLYRSGNTLMIS